MTHRVRKQVRSQRLVVVWRHRWRHRWWPWRVTDTLLRWLGGCGMGARGFIDRVGRHVCARRPRKHNNFRTNLSFRYACRNGSNRQARMTSTQILQDISRNLGTKKRNYTKEFGRLRRETLGQGKAQIRPLSSKANALIFRHYKNLPHTTHHSTQRIWPYPPTVIRGRAGERVRVQYGCSLVAQQPCRDLFQARQQHHLVLQVQLESQAVCEQGCTIQNPD